jgi:RNA polymerase primary sigma factor
MAKNDTQRSLEEIDQDDRQRQRMEIIREFIESKSKKVGRN